MTIIYRGEIFDDYLWKWHEYCVVMSTELFMASKLKAGRVSFDVVCCREKPIARQRNCLRHNPRDYRDKYRNDDGYG
jgi:hypothetical protein